jgi:hypothetical protein
MKAARTKPKPSPSRLTAGIFAALLHVVTASAEVSLTTLVHFDGTNGYMPGSSLVQDRDGSFYGILPATT